MDGSTGQAIPESTSIKINAQTKHLIFLRLTD